MNQFLNKTFFCFLAASMGVSPSILRAQSWVASSNNNALAVNSVAVTAPVISVAAQPVTPVSTVNSVWIPIVTSVVTPVVKSSVPVSSVEMPEVVITANRLDTPANEVPNSVTVITAEDLEKQQSKTVLDALQNVPGMDILQTGGAGETSVIYMRGASDEHTLVMIDGIPINDTISASRSYDYLDQLSLDDVSRIEIVRGPQSTLYGSNAMAGVVNIITKQGTGSASGSALFEGGSYGTFLGQASAQGGDTRGNYSLSMSDFSAAGFPSADKSFGNMFNNPDSNLSSVLTLGAKPISNFQENLLVHYSQSRTSLDDGAGAGMDDPNSWANQQQFLLASKTEWTLDNWKQFLTVSFVDDYRNYTNLADSTYINSTSYNLDYDGQTAQITWQNNIHLSSEETFVFGLEGSQEWGNQTSDYGSANPAVLNTQWFGSSFLQSQTNIEERLFINLGGRIDDYSTYGTHETYQAGVAYLVPELETKLKATYGTGFLAPTLYQLYAAAPTGNPDLQPETSTGYDFGFEQPLGKAFLVFGATYFHNDFDNLISYVGNFPTGQYMNIGAFQTQGAETFIDFKGIKSLVIRGSYTHTDILTDIPETQDNSPLLEKPTDQAGLDVDYKSGPVEAGTQVTYVSQRPDFNYATFAPVILNEYFLVNLRASYQVDEHVKLFARVDNLFNQYYEEIYGYGTPGLSAYGGTKISF
jgi:vitamin B12 transporter